MGPFIRIVLRYGVGAIIGYEVGDHLAADQDIIAFATAATAAIAGAATEGFYLLAKRLGWRT